MSERRSYTSKQVCILVTVVYEHARESPDCLVTHKCGVDNGEECCVPAFDVKKEANPRCCRA